MSRHAVAVAWLVLVVEAWPMWAAASEALTNDDVVVLTEAGLAPVAIVAKIESAPGAFDTSVDALVALAGKGVNSMVIAAMVAAGGAGAKSDVEPRRFTVLNRSDWTVVVVQASLPSEDTWGADRLGSGRLVPAGTDAVVEVDDHDGQCVFDVRIVASDAEGERVEQSYLGTDLCAVQLVFGSPGS